MAPQNELETKGSLAIHLLGEVIAEIRQAKLTGSLRGADKEKKWVIYFKNGSIVFAVSNARQARLFEMLLQRKRSENADLKKIPNAANDFEFAAFLQDKGFLTKQECDQLFTEQIRSIIVDALSWEKGDWTFSPFARIRDGLAFAVNEKQLLVDYARCMPVNRVLGRFRSMDESFSLAEIPGIDIPLNPDEGFVLSRATDAPQTASEMLAVAAMDEARAFHVLYTLWIGGLLTRRDWRSAFSEAQIRAIRGAKLELIREATVTVSPKVAAPATPTKSHSLSPQKVPEAKPQPVISLEDYLERVENAPTYYDLLGVNPDADLDDIKRAYFHLAKNFHPDRHHSQESETLRRIQRAFTELAQAHETLKNESTREMYDYRVRKELADREKRGSNAGERNIKLEQAEEHFDRGFSLLMDGEIEAATPFLARAVNYAPNSARYHAYYGKALATDETKQHKAESEMQAAIRLDPKNETFRIMLAEFFVQNNLLKRAEGELNRLLAVFPASREAQQMLQNLKR